MFLAQQTSALSAAQGVLFIFILVGAGVLLASVYVVSVVWAAMDAANRGARWYLVGLSVALGAWPIGLILWLIYRPAAVRPRVQ